MSKIINVDILTAEIGSTTTLVSAFDGINTSNPRLLGQGMAKTTVLEGDVRAGFRRALKDLAVKLGADLVEGGMVMATSSAAGGLKMTVHGLVPDMTARAAREAALGAGAVVRLVTCGKLTDSRIEQIKDVGPNIILIAGGVDYGERDTAVFNAKRIHRAGLTVPVVYGGNVECREEIKSIFKNSGQKLYVVDNVYPRIDELNTEGAGRAIQDAFAEHIVKAPGMDGVREMVGGDIMPTPGAVMEAAKLLYEGLGMEGLLVADIGGATTDIHSVTEASPENAGLLSAPEPMAKRTVEGDLGVFISAGNILEMFGKDAADTALGFCAEQTLNGYGGLPETENELRLTEFLAQEALKTALLRHAGRKRHVYGATGRITIAEGKDLSAVKYAVGTGGALTRLKNGGNILKRAFDIKNIGGGLLLPKPENIRCLIDKEYIMAQAGVISRADRESALKLMIKSLSL